MCVCVFCAVLFSHSSTFTIAIYYCGFVLAFGTTAADINFGEGITYFNQIFKMRLVVVYILNRIGFGVGALYESILKCVLYIRGG